MSQKPNVNETSFIGDWVVKKDKTVEGDDACMRIQWLTDSYFKLIVVDGKNWSALYKDPEDQRFWELTYPQGEMQGGGPPALHCISESDARKKYDF